MLRFGPSPCFQLLFVTQIFFSDWLLLVLWFYFKRPSTGKHSLTIWEYFLTGVEVRKKKDSNSAIVSKAPRWKILKCFVVYYVFVVVVFSGYLYAHISYLDDNCPACLLLLSTDRDAFFELAETRLKTVEVSCISLRNWMFASSSQFLVSSCYK